VGRRAASAEAPGARAALALALSLSLGGCTRAPAPPVVAPSAAVDHSVAWLADAKPTRFGPGAEAPAGCFAWSAERSSAACALGQWPHRRASQPRVVSFLAASGDEPVPLPILLTGEDASFAREPGIVAVTRNRLDVAMREGAFVGLPPSVPVPVNAEPLAVGRFTVSMRHQPTRRAPGSLAPAYASAVVVRLGPSGAPLVNETFGPGPCAEPTLTVVALSSTHLLVERACLFASQGHTDRHVAAWLCDATRPACR
jgi:hypothetical protein